jgi:hypothetical protein
MEISITVIFFFEKTSVFQVYIILRPSVESRIDRFGEISQNLNKSCFLERRARFPFIEKMMKESTKEKHLILENF